jgi:hypothetical protein
MAMAARMISDFFIVKQVTCKPKWVKTRCPTAYKVVL